MSGYFRNRSCRFPVTTGTAANALALAAITPRCSAIACHKGAHIFTDECAAPGFFCDSSPLIPIEGKNGKIGLDSLQSICELFSKNDPQCSPVKTLSITQATEQGTIYSLTELEALSNFSNANDIRLHMDGARFANYRNRLA
ncbi:MAG: beta-eliminating lyase-related protein [Sedimenticola sp.]